jgi:hypothetical protein
MERTCKVSFPLFYPIDFLTRVELGSLFDDSTNSWNVAKLDNLLTRLKPREKIPGVNTPYLYFGMWKATCKSWAQGTFDRVEMKTDWVCAC